MTKSGREPESIPRKIKVSEVKKFLQNNILPIRKQKEKSINKSG